MVLFAFIYFFPRPEPGSNTRAHHRLWIFKHEINMHRGASSLFFCTRRDKKWQVTVKHWEQIFVPVCFFLFFFFVISFILLFCFDSFALSSRFFGRFFYIPFFFFFFFEVKLAPVIVTNVTSLPTRAIKEPPSFVNLDRCPNREALSRNQPKNLLINDKLASLLWLFSPPFFSFIDYSLSDG